MTPVIRLAHVDKAFPGTGDQAGTDVLRHVAMTLQPGEKASLVGASGSGKSTLLSIIAGLRRPDAGVVEIDGVEIGELDDGDRARIRAGRIGIALQSDNLVPFLTARENVELAIGFEPGPHRRRRHERRQRALRLLASFGVAHRADHDPRQLSGGEAQRVALAVSIANDPALLLADEVVAQLDGETAGGVIEHVLAAPFAVLFVTHETALADLATTHYALADGQLVDR